MFVVMAPPNQSSCSFRRWIVERKGLVASETVCGPGSQTMTGEKYE
jgi:hypothetical protein